MTRSDYLLLTTYCLLLFGVSLVSGRPLSIHEAVLPQSAREMLADGDWIVPKKGGAPWLESPPLPQWVTVSLAGAFGRCDDVWIVRLGPTLVSTLTVLLAASMASRLFGRRTGLLSGLILATTCEFTRYAWLAEDEIYLCAVVTAAMALFARIEFSETPLEGPYRRGLVRRFFGGRPWWVLAFFVVLGMTNMVKGLAFGTAMVVVPVGVYLLWNRDRDRITRYTWFWGWGAFAAVALAWPLAVYARHPDVLELWWYDLGGRMDGSYADINEPVWYYAVNLLWVLAPWTLVVPFGLWATRHRALRERSTAERFLWCWAIAVPVFLTFASGKHHHYLLPALVPWAVLSAFGLVQAREWLRTWPRLLRNPWVSLATVALPACVAVWFLRPQIPGPEWLPFAALGVIPALSVVLTWAFHQASAPIAARVLFVTLGVAYAAGHCFAGRHADRHRFDAKFLQQVRAAAGEDATLLVDMDVDALRGFFCLFYLDERAVPLHNLSFAVDKRLPRENVYVVTQHEKVRQLQSVARAEVALQSDRPGRDGDSWKRLTLFQLHFHPDAPRVAADGLRISPMQAMYRTAGPTLSRF